MKGICNWFLLLSHWTIIVCLVWLVQYMVIDLWINQDIQRYCSCSKFKLDFSFWYPNVILINIKNIIGKKRLLSEICEWSRVNMSKMGFKIWKQQRKKFIGILFFSTYANVCERMSNNLLLSQHMHFKMQIFYTWSLIFFSYANDRQW